MVGFQQLAQEMAIGVGELFLYVVRRGFDTMACPLSAMSVMLPIVWLFGGTS